ncbi:ubiquinone biosynthesis protein UbiB [Seohaeicola saemankumensis]|jgi:ubiquinone biosynthesis protein|uniref:ABC1 kinase family protein n=1 Tax=Seohaeicola saemankumensis TaxID=481181 RepID=UPI001E46F9EC|nr:AarF/UbiB family protein [Seohaeicola saemankumensis]MCD1627974.1 ubiquinone biosynthesis protein UbiB [Seohaeicola saemankumensis]
MSVVLGVTPDLRRLGDLVAVLARYGFSETLERAGLSRRWHKTGSQKAGDADSSGLTSAERLRRALEEMGPTFVKLGQILSTRIDLFEPDIIAELERLRDRVPTVPFAELAAEVEAELGQPLSAIFERIDTKPLAAGSIAQVHGARLATGEEVILKIRRPGIRRVIESDLRLLRHAVGVALAEWPDLVRYHPHEILAEFARSIRAELDLANECRNAERVAAGFRDRADIHVPRVLWDWTCEVMNVQERIEGIPGGDLAAAHGAGLDLKRIAARGADAVLHMILEERFFHADPHAGNVFFLPGNELVFIDFGMVGHLSRRRRDELVDLLYGIVERRPDRVARILRDWAGADAQDDPTLEVRLEAFIDRVYGRPLGALNLSELVFDLTALMRAHDLALPPDLTLLVKAFVSLDGMGRQLDPSFDMVATARPILERLMWQRHGPEAMARAARQGLGDSARLAARLPGDLTQLLDAARRGRLGLRVELAEIERIAEKMRQSVTHLTLAVVVAALTVGSSIVTAASGADLPFGLASFAMLGFFGAVIGGFILLWSIWRNGRK